MTRDLSKEGPRVGPEKIDYVALWQYFEKRGSELKGTMLQLLTLLIGFAAAILGYGMDKALNFDSWPFVQRPLLLVVLAVVGAAIVIFAEIVIQEFGEHINRNFDRADYSRIGDRPLDEILDYSEGATSSTQELPSIWTTVRRVTRFFAATFLVGGVFGLIETQKLPSICTTVRRITRFFAAAFLVGGVFGLIKLVA